MQGVSTTRAQQLREKLCGEEFSSTDVSRIAAVLDEEVGKFKQRTLVAYTYLYLDA